MRNPRPRRWAPATRGERRVLRDLGLGVHPQVADPESPETHLWAWIEVVEAYRRGTRRPLGAGMLLAHLTGDYLLQTNHQAQEKLTAWGPALLHAATYTAAHLPLTRDPVRLLVIGGTHAVIDRYRLARHVVWAKNQLAPARHRNGHTATGYSEDMPVWLSTWLMIACDNTLHLLINAAALRARRG